MLAERRQDRRVDRRAVGQQGADRVVEARAFDVALGDSDHVVTAEQRGRRADLRRQQPDDRIATGRHEVLGADLEVLDVEAVADVDQTADRERFLGTGPHLLDLEPSGAEVALDERSDEHDARDGAARCTRSGPARAAACPASSCGVPASAGTASRRRRIGGRRRSWAPNRRARSTPAPTSRRASASAAASVTIAVASSCRTRRGYRSEPVRPVAARSLRARDRATENGGVSALRSSGRAWPGTPRSPRGCRPCRG